MIIRKVAVGNSEEAFIEDTFSEGLNILLSDDNNKGKTIIIQSMLYALGNKLEIISIIDSPILGGDGNKEKLALIKGIF